MLIFKKATDLKGFLEKERRLGSRIGFVPTMGALHEGHLALVRHSLQQTGRTVVSIFVNPTQFNQAEDLARYPRQPEQDLLLLGRLGDPIVFLPSEREIYPPGEDTSVPLELGHLATVMEGKFRPGHFNGVAQVVKRLLDLVRPDLLVMGQKDLQQLRVIAALIEAYQLPVRLEAFPTQRDARGLALSSRNMRLSEARRREAASLYQTLTEAARRYLSGEKASKLMEWGIKTLESKDFRVEYFELVQAESLKRLPDDAPLQEAAICVAAWVGPVRLIDNLLVKP